MSRPQQPLSLPRHLLSSGAADARFTSEGGRFEGASSVASRQRVSRVHLVFPAFPSQTIQSFCLSSGSSLLLGGGFDVNSSLKETGKVEHFSSERQPGNVSSQLALYSFLEFKETALTDILDPSVNISKGETGKNRNLIKKIMSYSCSSLLVCLRSFEAFFFFCECIREAFMSA